MELGSSSERAGKDLGDVIGIKEKMGITVQGDIADLNVNADIAIHATTSFLDGAYPQIIEIIKWGLNVISTCEELSYPLL